MEGITISDKGRYCFRMRGSVMDKCFWVDKVPGTKTVVDWGCADGSMLFWAYHLNPDAGVRYVGFDRDKDMVDMARKAWNGPESISDETFKKVENANEIMEFSDSLTGLYDSLSDDSSDSMCLVLSSVLHEILSEHGGLSRDSLVEFAKDVAPKYIAIRDMQFRVADPERTDVDYDVFKDISPEFDPYRIDEFVDMYGGFSKLKNLVHFLLKRRYPDNWEHELCEDYFAAKQPAIDAMFPDYEPIYWNRYLPPFLRDEIEKKDGLCMDGVTTHVQLILRHKRFSKGLRKDWTC